MLIYASLPRKELTWWPLWNHVLMDVDAWRLGVWLLLCVVLVVVVVVVMLVRRAVVVGLVHEPDCTGARTM